MTIVPITVTVLHGYIHRLRKLLINDNKIKIINIRGIGYKLVVQ